MSTQVGPAARSDKQSNFRAGMVLYVGLALLFVALMTKTQLLGMVHGGKTITAEFSDASKLRANDSSVKVAGLEVGDVTGISRIDENTVKVTMNVDDDVFPTLGSQPTARIEPRTLLGGRYVVELHAAGGGGPFDGNIPLSRTSDPTELDAVAEALPKTSRQAVSGLVGNAGPALEKSAPALHHLLGDAPGVLQPGGEVLGAARGEDPATDLPNLVTDLHSTARILNERPSDLTSIAEDLNATIRVLATHRTEIGRVLHDLPTVERNATAGIAGLDSTVTQLQSVANDVRPSAPKLTQLLDDLDPLLTQARPLLKELRPVLRNARPLVRTLVPVSSRATRILTDVHGPVLDRVNGPVSQFVLSPWKGTGPYAGGGAGYLADHKFYQELAYMATNIDRASMTQDVRGSTLAFQAGVGLDSISGVPFDMNHLMGMALNQAGVSGVMQKSILKNLGLIP